VTGFRKYQQWTVLCEEVLTYICVLGINENLFSSIKWTWQAYKNRANELPTATTTATSLKTKSDNAAKQISSCKLNLANASDTCKKMCEIELNMYAKTEEKSKKKMLKRKHVAKKFGLCLVLYIHIYKSLCLVCPSHVFPKTHSPTDL